MSWGNEWNKGLVIVGVDQGSPSGDTTIVSLWDGKDHHVIGENVSLVIPVNAWVNKTINCLKIGDLAVPGPDFEWSVVHVPTLTRFDKAVPDGEWFEEQLLKWCWQVQQSHGDLWEDLAKYNNSNYKEISIKLLDLIKDHCLATLMEN